LKIFSIVITVSFSAVLPIYSSAGVAYQTVEGSCLASGCHSQDKLHPIHSSQLCTTCHTEIAGSKPILLSNCAACHPRAGDKGGCPLINNVAKHPKSMCLICHT